MQGVEAKLGRLGIELPSPPKAMATYSPAVRTGNLLMVAGQGPVLDGRITVKGRVGKEVDAKTAYEAARLSCLNALAVAREALGSLDRIRRPVRATVWVACTETFGEQPQVANGATDLLRDLWGAENLPARSAVGTNALPLGIPVEVELTFEVS
ncbi:MAG: RidA family protein [Methanobacteriota archaeon]